MDNRNISSRQLSRLIVLSLILAITLYSCQSMIPTPVATPTAQSGKELIFHYWADYFPQSVIDAFTSEYGIPVRTVPYESYEDARDHIIAGQAIDVAILSPDQVVELIAAEKLASINYENIPNFKNISLNFRDLTHDPGNQYSIPFVWGTEGILVNRDLVQQPVTRWSDLWAPEFAGKVGIWLISTSMIPIALKTLGYSVNSENHDELQAALQKMLELKIDRQAVLLPSDLVSSIPLLQSGEIWITFGWAYDALLAQDEGVNIEYILPEEGGILWSEVLVIPQNSPNRPAAELFLNFLLRPEISAQIMRETRYAMPNEPAIALLEPELRDNPLIFPALPSLVHAEILVPRSLEGQRFFDQIWNQFLNQP